MHPHLSAGDIMVVWAVSFVSKADAESAAFSFEPVNFSTSIAASLNADAAVQNIGHVSNAATEPAQLNLDCVGHWSACTSACEAKKARQWFATVARRGDGAVCPNITTDCHPGEGGCVAHIDCTGHWSTCTAACEAKQVRVWVQVTAPSGIGTACPAAAADCHPGEGECVASANTAESSTGGEVDTAESSTGGADDKDDLDQLAEGCLTKPPVGALAAAAMLVLAPLD